MSLMDDVFDLTDHVKGSVYESAFDRVTERLWEYEEAYDSLRELTNHINGIEQFARTLKMFAAKEFNPANKLAVVEEISPLYDDRWVRNNVKQVAKKRVWVGYVDGKPHDCRFDGRGCIAVYTTKKEAKKHYEDVRPLELK